MTRGRSRADRRATSAGAVAVVTLIAAFGVSAPGLAADPTPAARALLTEGINRFYQLDLQGSIGVLERALVVASDRSVRARIHLYVGINNAVLGDERKARIAFAAALALEPKLALDPDRIKPSIATLFATVRAKMAQAAKQVKQRKRVKAAKYSAPVAPKVKPKPPPQRAVAPGPPRVLTWVAAGLAGTFAVIGIALGVSARGDADDYHRLPPTETTTLDALEARIGDKARATNAMLGLSGVFAAGAVALFFFERRLMANARRPRRDGSRGRIAVAPWIGRGAGIAMAAKF